MLCPKCQTSLSDHEGFCPTCKSPAPSQIYIHATPALKNLFVAAAQLLREGKVEEAADACRDRHAENPAIAGPFVVMGDIYRLHGQFSEAIAAYKQAIERTPPYLTLVQQKLDDTIDLVRAARLAAERAAAPPPLVPEPQAEPEPELPPLRPIGTAVAEPPAPPSAIEEPAPALPPPPEPLPPPQWEDGPEAEEEAVIAIIPAPKLEAPPQIPLIEEEESNVLEGEVRVAGLPMTAPRPPVEEAEEEGTFIPAAWLEPKRALIIIGALLLLFMLLLVLNAKPWQPRYTPPRVTIPIPMNEDENINWTTPLQHEDEEKLPELKGR